MTAEIVCVGTEILLGNIVNTNAVYISQKCAGLGIPIYYQTAIGDNEKRLEQMVKTAFERSDIVIFSGGLGPTEDDLTKETVAKALGTPLVEDEHSKERIKGYFKTFKTKVITENNWKQAMVPEGSFVMDNNNGTAPGIIIEKNGKTAVLLPGPPNELVPMFEESVIPYFKEKNSETIYSVMVKLCGVGESSVENAILDMIDSQTNPTIATYAKTGEVHLRVTALAKDEAEAKRIIKPMLDELEKRFGDSIFTMDENESFEDSIVKMLTSKNLTVTTVESCSGGLIAGRIVNSNGASNCFKEGYVTYSNEAKMKLVGVKEEVLKEFGAVSHETAVMMAEGGAKAAGSDMAVAVTGIAGPNGGSEEKPVGLVYIACFDGSKTTVDRCIFKGNREKVRTQTVVRALTMLRECIIYKYGK